MLRLVIYTFISIFLASAAGSCGQKGKGSALPYGGIYMFGDILEREGRHGEAYIYPENDTTLLFYVYVNKGAPSYNSGSMDGRITVNGGKAIFQKTLRRGGLPVAFWVWRRYADHY